MGRECDHEREDRNRAGGERAGGQKDPPCERRAAAFAAAFSADRLVRAGDAREVAAAVLAADWGSLSRSSPGACDLLLDGLALLTREGFPAGAPPLMAAMSAFRDEPLSDVDELRWLWLALQIARALGDDATWGRAHAALTLLPVALSARVGAELFSGRIAVATSLAAEAEAVVEATGSHLAPRTAIVIANWRGRDAEAVALTEARRQDVLRRREGLWFTINDLSSAICYNGLGRYDDALAVAERAVADPRGLGSTINPRSELIEAAVRSGRPERTVAPLAQLAESRQPPGRNGRSAATRALRRCSQREQRPRRSTARRSNGWRARGDARRSPARTCSTANGCGAMAAGSTLASSCASRTSC